MPKFITIGDGDQDGYDRTQNDLKARAQAIHAFPLSTALRNVSGESVQS